MAKPTSARGDTRQNAKRRDDYSRAILKGIGGKDNVAQAWNCITRLRFTLKNDDLVDIEAVTGVPTVMKAQFQSGQFQVIIGPGVEHQFASMAPMLNPGAVDGSDAVTVSESKKLTPRHLLDLLISTLSGIFNPILPAIVGGGILKGLLVLLTTVGWLDAVSDTYAVLNLVGDAPFYFLPFLLAASASARFNLKTSLGLCVAGVLMYPTLIDGAAAIAEGGPASLQFLGLAIPFNSYSSAVIPPILGVWFMSKVYKIVDRMIPKSLKIIFTPLITLLISMPIILIALAPLGNYLGELMATGALWLWTNGGIFFGIAMGGLMPLIVLVGAHYAFFPSIFQNLKDYHADFFFLPFSFIQNMAQAGAGFAVAIRTRNKEDRSLAISTAIPAVFGITEPVMFGVTIRLRRPFIAAMLGGALGGAWASWTMVQTAEMTLPGITSIPTYIPDSFPADLAAQIPNNLLNIIISVGISFITAFVLTLILGFKDAPTAEADVSLDQGTNVRPPSTSITSPIVGEVVALDQIPDEVFAAGVLGPGVGLIPAEGEVVAPFDGEVATISATKHAVALRSVDGIELLIHVGLDTVSLNGAPFTVMVHEGEAVEAGQPILHFDIEAIKSAGLSTVTPVVVVNARDAELEVTATSSSNATQITEILSVTRTDSGASLSQKETERK